MFKQRLRWLESLLHRGELDKRLKPAARPLQTAQDVMDLLAEQVEAVRADPWASTVEKARALAHLAGVARKTLETAKLAQRIEMLELVLKQRTGDTRR